MYHTHAKKFAYLPVKNLTEMIDYVRANPGKVACALDTPTGISGACLGSFAKAAGVMRATGTPEWREFLKLGGLNNSYRWNAADRPTAAPTAPKNRLTSASWFRSGKCCTSNGLYCAPGSSEPLWASCLVLGPMIERHFRRGLQIANGDPMAFFGHPLAVGILIAIIFMYAACFYGMRKRKKARADA